MKECYKHNVNYKELNVNPAYNWLVKTYDTIFVLEQITKAVFTYHRQMSISVNTTAHVVSWDDKTIINNLREKFSPGPGIEPAGENFSLKLLIYDLSEGYSKAKISS